MDSVTAVTARMDFDSLIDLVTRQNEPVTIVADDNRAVVLLSMDEWSGIQETLYLQSVPGLVESIKAGELEPLECCIDESELDCDV